MSKYKTPEYREKHAAHARENRKKNKELTYNRHQRWKKNNPEKYKRIQRNSSLKKNYGITIEEFELILKDQGNRCAICRTDDPGRQWFVDHCHTVNRVRGILCSSCNSVLGYAKDDTSILKAAIKYLQRGLLFEPKPKSD